MVAGGEVVVVGEAAAMLVSLGKVFLRKVLDAGLCLVPVAHGMRSPKASA
jgi:hypothetical protein